MIYQKRPLIQSEPFVIDYLGFRYPVEPTDCVTSAPYVVMKILYDSLPDQIEATMWQGTPTFEGPEDSARVVSDSGERFFISLGDYLTPDKRVINRNLFEGVYETRISDAGPNV